MATITSVGSGLWSAAGTWDAGVPVDNDSVVIASGHVVEFDVNQSAFANGMDGIVVTGTLSLTTTPGTYYLKIKAAKLMTGAGTFQCGTQNNPIPFATKHTISGGSAWGISGGAGLTINVYAAEPQYTTLRLTVGESAAATVLRVDTDVTGDIWQAGDTINVDNIDGARNSEQYTIAVGGIAANTITITVGLSASKIAGSFVHLVTRNVRFIHNPSISNQHLFSSIKGTFMGGEITRAADGYCFGSSVVTIGAGVFVAFGRVFNGCGGTLISGGLFSNNTYVIYSNGITVTGGIWSGNSSIAYIGSGLIFSGGEFAGNSYFLFTQRSFSVMGGLIYGNTYSIRTSEAGIISNVSLISSNVCLYEVVDLTLYNTILTSPTEFLNYNTMAFRHYTQSIHHNGVDGAYKAWTLGGIITSQSVTKPSGYIQAYQMALESADSPCFYKRSFTVAAGESVNIEVYLRKDAVMAYLPRVYLMESIDDPLGGASPCQTFTITDSVDTWESDTFAITNSTAYDHNYTLWFVAKNATGNVYAALSFETVPDTSDIALAVWSYATKELTTPADYMADVSALATSAEIAALNDLDAAGIRAAVGLAAANLDDQFLNLVAWAAINLDVSISEGTIIQIRGNSWSIDIADLTLDVNKQQFAIKYTHLNASLNQSAPSWNATSPDADSLVFIDSDTCLLYLNGVQAADPTLGSLSYVGTTLTVTLSPAATQLLAPGTYTFGIQSVTALGVVSEAYGGTFTITADIVRSIS